MFKIDEKVKSIDELRFIEMMQDAPLEDFKMIEMNAENLELIKTLKKDMFELQNNLTLSRAENVSQKETIKEFTEVITKLKKNVATKECMLYAAATEIEFHRSIIQTLQTTIELIDNLS